MAKIKSKTSPELLSRSEYSKEKDGHNLEAFFKLKIGIQVDARENYADIGWAAE